MKYSARVFRSALVGAWAIVTVLHCAAEQAPSNVEALISGNRWKEASRAIFLEAKSANKLEWSIPVGQAKAGFLADALDTIAGMHPNVQADALLALVANVPSISPKHSVELVQRVLDLARTKSGETANNLKSGELAKVALFYSRNGAESDARAIFEEALRAAEIGVTEKGSDGYKRISSSLVRDPKGSQDWMIMLIAKHLQRQGKTEDSAFAYIDLAQVAVRQNKSQMTPELIESGISAAKTIKRDFSRKLALDRLASVAIEAGYTKGLPKTLPDTQAVQEARSGNLKKALAIASGLSRNMYVDHGLAAHERIFDDAVKREDLNAALYFAENSVQPIPWRQANAWRQIAELQAKKGVKQDAANSYLRASQAISDSPGYLGQVKSTLSLGASMHQNGFEAEGRKATLDALAMIDLIPERRTDDRISAATLAAETLWRYGIHSEAKQQALRAYRAASGYSDKNGSKKALLLSELGEATSTFIAKASDQRVESRDRKKTK